jgi:hypothetical protein
MRAWELVKEWVTPSQVSNLEKNVSVRIKSLFPLLRQVDSKSQRVTVRRLVAATHHKLAALETEYLFIVIHSLFQAVGV